jgi:regulatory protein
MVLRRLAPRRTVTPPTIDRLEPDRRSKEAVGLVVDGRVELTVPLEALRAEGVTSGTVLTDELRERLAAAADRAAAYRTALRLLERRSFARRDLGRRLSVKGHQADAVEAALERAESAGLLDDERFARNYVQTRGERGRGPARLRRELRAQGVADSISERVLCEEITPEQSDAAARELAVKRLQQLRHLDRAVRLRRVVAYLARRGYTGSAMLKMVRELNG